MSSSNTRGGINSGNPPICPLSTPINPPGRVSSPLANVIIPVEGSEISFRNWNRHQVKMQLPKCPAIFWGESAKTYFDNNIQKLWQQLFMLYSTTHQLTQLAFIRKNPHPRSAIAIFDVKLKENISEHRRPWLPQVALIPSWMASNFRDYSL